jgi:hypothetical protein
MEQTNNLVRGGSQEAMKPGKALNLLAFHPCFPQDHHSSYRIFGKQLHRLAWAFSKAETAIWVRTRIERVLDAAKARGLQARLLVRSLAENGPVSVFFYLQKAKSPSAWLRLFVRY